MPHRVNFTSEKNCPSHSKMNVIVKFKSHEE